MRSLHFLKSRARRVQHALQSTGLGLLVLAGIVGTAEEAQAQDEASVLLCDLTYTVKLKRMKKSFASLSDDFAGLWNAQRASDQRDTCKRYFQNKDSKRLSKLVEIGKGKNAAYVIAPAANKKGRDVELSFWLVDVASEKMVTSFAAKVSSKTKQFDKDLPGALEETVSTMMTALNTDLAEKAPPKVEEAPAEDPAKEEAVAEATATGDAATSSPAAPAEENVAATPVAEAAAPAAVPVEEKPAAATATAAAPAPAAEVPVPAEAAAKKENGFPLRSVLVGVSSGLIGAGIGGVVGGAVVAKAGADLRNWEAKAAMPQADRSELNNVLTGVAVLADASTIGLIGVSVVGAGILAATLLIVEE